MTAISEMNADLRWQLEQSPTSVKNLTRLLGKSETWVRDNIKKFTPPIQCKKDETGTNVFWLAVETNEPRMVETKDGPVEFDPKALEIDPSQHPGGITETPAEDKPAVHEVGCPFCHSVEPQKPAGEEGTFLGACLTCPNCHKTYNAITRKEVKGAPSAAKGKRVILNPQHKIRAKVDAVQEAGGRLRFDKNDRLWVLETKGGDSVTFTAEKFAVETPETMVAKVG